jgi:hypothetical protein
MSHIVCGPAACGFLKLARVVVCVLYYSLWPRPCVWWCASWVLGCVCFVLFVLCAFGCLSARRERLRAEIDFNRVRFLAASIRTR